MPIGQVAAVTFAAVACLASWRSRQEWSWLAIGLAALAFMALGLIRDGFRPVVIAGPVSASIVFAALLMGMVIWAHALGLPRRLATVLGIGLTSRPLRFNNRMQAIAQPLRETINAAIDEPIGRSTAAVEAQRRVREMRAIHPPDAAWAQMRDEVADGYQGWIDLLRVDAPRDRFVDHAQAFAPVMAQWTEMRKKAANDQQLLATPTRRRRGRVIWLATSSVSVLVTSLARARADDVSALPVSDPRLWVTLALLIMGALLLMAALVVAIRH
jgi:hypothetical protein